MNLTAKAEKAGLIIACLLTTEDFENLAGWRKTDPEFNNLLFVAATAHCMVHLKRSCLLYDDGTTLPLERKHGQPTI